MVRAGGAADLDAIARIQAASPTAAQWRPEDYLVCQLLVAVLDGCIVGFLAGRTVAEGEREVLNLAVAPEYRRRGAARGLLEAYTAGASGHVFLEVRKSNQAARNLYKSIGFQEVGVRRGYYQMPLEDSVVMNLRSC